MTEVVAAGVLLVVAVLIGTFYRAVILVRHESWYYALSTTVSYWEMQSFNGMVFRKGELDLLLAELRALERVLHIHGGDWTSSSRVEKLIALNNAQANQKLVLTRLHWCDTDDPILKVLTRQERERVYAELENCGPLTKATSRGTYVKEQLLARTWETLKPRIELV